MPSGRPSLACHRDGLEVLRADGSSDRFGWSWLRDACPCDECRADGGRQRRLEITTLRFPVPAPAIVVDENRVLLDWTEDGTLHRSAWSLESLYAWRDTRARPAPVLVAAGSGGPPLLCRDWPEVHGGGPELTTVLAAVVTHGAALIRGVPPESEAVRDVVATFGYLRPTNYGEVFDVRSVIDPSNLANSPVGLGPHTDNPYRSPPPSVQVLHCLRTSAAGGETILVDVFTVADELARRSPDAFGGPRRRPDHGQPPPAPRSDRLRGRRRASPPRCLQRHGRPVLPVSGAAPVDAGDGPRPACG